MLPFSTLLIVLLSCFVSFCNSLSSTAPNIIFIVADDLGFADCSFTGMSDVQTPNIDSLFNSGLRLSRYYGQPVCTPSRAAIHTGRYPLSYGLQTYVIPAGAPYGLNLNETTLPELLRDGGYDTHATGKYHLGFYNWNSTPTFRGYNSFRGFYSGGQDYNTHKEGKGFDLHFDIGKNCGPGCSKVDWENNNVYSSYIYTSRAIEIIKDRTTESPPLFLYVAYQAVHSPDEVPQKYIDPYNTTIPDKKRRTFAGMLSALDEGVGNITVALRDANMLDNTLIAFVADNGGPIQCDSGICGDATGTSNYPLRGGKHSLWEGGIRLTSIVSGPMLFAHGINASGLMHHVDWLPTLLEAAGIEYTPKQGFDLHGISQWRMLTKGSQSQRNETICNIDPLQPAVGDKIPPGSGNAAIISDLGWKLHLGLTGPPDSWSLPNSSSMVESINALADILHNDTTNQSLSVWPLKNMTVQLFNLNDDPYERNEISKLHPDIVLQLTNRLAYWGQTAATPYYATSSAIDPKSDPTLHNGTWVPWMN
jgi:arylsulfatase A-like enzyme